MRDVHLQEKIGTNMGQNRESCIGYHSFLTIILQHTEIQVFPPIFDSSFYVMLLSRLSSNCNPYKTSIYQRLHLEDNLKI